MYVVSSNEVSVTHNTTTSVPSIPAPSPSGPKATGSDSTTSTIIGATVGVTVAMLLAIAIITCAIIVYRRKKMQSVSYLLTHSASG